MPRLISKRQSDRPPSRRAGSQSDRGAQKANTPGVPYKINRTLTGVRRFVQGDSTESATSRSKTHRLSSHRQRASLLFLVSVILVIALGWIIVQLTASVKVVTSDNRLTQDVDESIYENAISDYMDSHLVSRLRQFLNTEAMRKELATNYPEIKSIEDKSKTNLFETNYLVSFRKPVAGWKVDDKQYFVDADGVSFEKNYYDKPTVQITDETGIRLEKGAPIASNRLLSFVGKVVSTASEKGYNVTEAKLPVDTARQLDIKLEGVRPYIKLSIDRGVGVQIEDMDNALRYLFSKNINPEYLDIRISSKAFYK